MTNSPIMLAKTSQEAKSIAESMGYKENNNQNDDQNNDPNKENKPKKTSNPQSENESESSSGLNEGESRNKPDKDPEDSEDDVPNKEVVYDGRTNELERLDEDLEKLKWAIRRGDNEAKEELKKDYPQFFRHSSSDEEDMKALKQLEEELEDEFQDIEEYNEAQDQAEAEAKAQAEAEAEAEAKAQTDAEAEAESNIPVTSGKRKASDTELDPNKRQDISDSNDENDNGKGGPSGFSGGGGPSTSAGGDGPSSSGSLKTMVNEVEFSNRPSRNMGSPIDFVIELENTTCIYEYCDFMDEII